MTKRGADEDFRSFIDSNLVSPHLFCSICQEVFVNPYRAPCGHSYCKACIVEWLKNSKTCPEDRKKLQIKDMHHDFIIENIIGDQKVCCPYREHGCADVSMLSNLNEHIKNCSFNPSNIPEFLKKDFHSMGSQCGDESAEKENNTNSQAYMPLKLRLFQAGGTKRERLVKAFSKQESPKSKIRKLMQLIDED